MKGGGCRNGILENSWCLCVDCHVKPINYNLTNEGLQGRVKDKIWVCPGAWMDYVGVDKALFHPLTPRLYLIGVDQGMDDCDPPRLGDGALVEDDGGEELDGRHERVQDLEVT